MYIHVYIYIYTYIDIIVYLYKWISTYIYTHIDMHIYMYIHYIHTHTKVSNLIRTHTHTYTHPHQNCPKRYRQHRVAKMHSLIIIGHYPQKSPIISGSLAKRDLQQKAFYASSHQKNVVFASIFFLMYGGEDS